MKIVWAGPLYEVGHTRNRGEFVWWKTIGNETRVLQFAHWMETFAQPCMATNNDVIHLNKRPRWVAVRWL